MQVKESKLFEDLVMGGIQGKRKNTALKPLDSNLTVESPEQMRAKFKEDRRLKMEAQRAEEELALKRALRWRMNDANAARDAREAQRIKDIKAEDAAFIKPLDKFLKNKHEQDQLAAKELLHEWDEKAPSPAPAPLPVAIRCHQPSPSLMRR